MKSIDDVIAALKMRSADDQVAIMRALAEDNGYVVVAGYSITGREPVVDTVMRQKAEIEQLRAALRQAIPALLDAANRLGDMELADLENACWDAHQAACAAMTSEQSTGESK